MAEATADTATDTQPETTDTDTEATDTDALQAEVEKWKALAKKHEDRSKGNAAKARELEELQKAQMTDTERAVAEALDKGRNEALMQVGAKLVDAEFRVAAAGRNLDVDALLEGLDRTKFLTDDGEPDSDAVAAWVDRIAPAATTEESGAPLSSFDLGQGTRESTPIGDDKAFERMLTDLVK
jgi:hypothetical protein